MASTISSGRTNLTEAPFNPSIAILLLSVLPLPNFMCHLGLTPLKQDLVQWTFVNKLLTVQASGDLGPNRVVERPRVIYNDATGKYVMWMHIDSSSYSEAKVGVATSSSVCGTYSYM